MGMSTLMKGKNVVSDEKLYKTEREYRAAKDIQNWSEVPYIGDGLQEMAQNNWNKAANTAFMLSQERAAIKRIEEAQLSPAIQGIAPENLLMMVRLSMPNLCRNEVFTEYAMESPKDSIIYIEPKLGPSAHKTSEGLADKNAYYNGDAKEIISSDDPWKFAADAWTAGTATYEHRHDRMVSELCNVSPEAGVFEFKGGLNGKFGAEGQKYLPGYTAVYLGVETNTIATENKRPGILLASTELSDYFTAELEQKNKVWTLTVTPNKDAISAALADTEDNGLKIALKAVIATEEYKVASTEKALTLADVTSDNILDLVKAFGRFDSEDDFEGDNMGEMNIQMRSYTFEPRPSTIGITWSKMTDIVLDSAFGVSAEEYLVSYAAAQIRSSLDYRAFRTAVAIAKANNKNYHYEFDAQFVRANGATATQESYRDTAQTFLSAIDTIGDSMNNSINRGGVSTLVAGQSAGTYIRLNDLYVPEGRRQQQGVFRFGTLDGMPVYKAPVDVIPTNEVLTVWKNPENAADICMAFGTLIPFFSTNILQRKNFYSEGAIATFGDYVCLRPDYLGLIRIKNLKDATSATRF